VIKAGGAISTRRYETQVLQAQVLLAQGFLIASGNVESI